MKIEDSQVSTNKALLDMLFQYKKTNRTINVKFRKLVNYTPANERSVHLIHPYPAKLLTHIPYFFLANDILSKRGDTVLDPFSGSGTVLFESQLFGRKALGAEVNPLARLISKVKTSKVLSITLKNESVKLIKRIPKFSNKEFPDVLNLEYWYYPHVTRQLNCLLEAINKTIDQKAKDFFLVCFSHCARKVSLADPRISVPVRLHHDQYLKSHPLYEKTKAHLNQLKRINVSKVFQQILNTNLKRICYLDSFKNELPIGEVICSDARNLNYEFSNNGYLDRRINKNSIQLIITSPPYPGSQKYIRSCQLNLGWLGYCSSSGIKDLKRQAIGREEVLKDEYISFGPIENPLANRTLKKIGEIDPTRMRIAGVYLNEMRTAIQEMYRVLKNGGYLVLIVGNNEICGFQFKTQAYLHNIAKEIGFELKLKLIDNIHSRGLMTKRNRTAGIITREWVLVYKKGER